MKAVTTDVMRDLDRRTIEAGTPGEGLMERAGEGALREISHFLSCLPRGHAERLLVLCGKGNNGGDGYVVARLAHAAGVPVEIVSTCPVADLSGDALVNAKRLPQSVDFSILPAQGLSPKLTSGNVVVDALLGTGISSSVRSPVAECIEAVNGSGLPVAALDIPSGLNGTSGEICGCAIVADLTIAMGLPKVGLFRGEGPAHTGRLRIVDIGLDPQASARAASDLQVISRADVAPFLGRRSPAGHKGTFGSLAVVGGAGCYAGAPVLAARGALRAGCGLCSLFVPASLGGFIDRSCLALIVRPVEDGGSGRLVAASCAGLAAWQGSMDAVVVGCGMTDSRDGLPVLDEILGWDCPKVVDADGLRLLAACPELLRGRKNEMIVTPHPGEMKLLLAAFCPQSKDASREDQALALASTIESTVILKGQGTIIASPDRSVWLNTTGRSSLATAGSGDVLSGIVGSLLAQGLTPFDAARCGVYSHGLAGEIGQAGDRGLIADDLPGLIPEAFRLTHPFA